MKTPFTVDQFLDVFKNYNEAIWPMQVIFYLMGLVVIYLVFKPGSKAQKIINIVLAFLWLWMGIVYHLMFFTAINKAAYLFGGIFILQGVLILFYGVFQNKLSFKFRSGLYGVTGIVLILFALIFYPVLGYFLGHLYPSSPTFGLPCPTTIFTFGLLLLTDKKCPVAIMIIPFIWSVIGFMAAFNFGIVEDTGLLVSGLLTLPMLIIRNKKYIREVNKAQP
ncbi:MAG: hypothetical protein IPP15_23780 [Saprospiraceae bacterium]|uniref:MFS transporter permease n=1 Tax=Candidatus Opimibacter skivensis TaxID=2982028 RepID=A0A9D7SZR4_9BACT|nr:hypothetical protein [Candidatus Opimibacter skivensis]